VNHAAARTVLRVDFAPARRQRATVPATGRVPRVARLLALAYRIDSFIQAGQLRDLADAARLLGLTRARVTHVMNLTLLAPAIQAEILDLPPTVTGRDRIAERQLRPIVSQPDWDAQIRIWRQIHG